MKVAFEGLWSECVRTLPVFITGTCKRETYKHQGPQVTAETQTKPARALVGAELLRWALGPAHCEEG